MCRRSSRPSIRVRWMRKPRGSRSVSMKSQAACTTCRLLAVHSAGTAYRREPDARSWQPMSGRVAATRSRPLGALAALRMTPLSREVARTGLLEHAPVRHVVPVPCAASGSSYGNCPGHAPHECVGLAREGVGLVETHAPAFPPSCRGAGVDEQSPIAVGGWTSAESRRDSRKISVGCNLNACRGVFRVTEGGPHGSR
jgi:hypothetical protein